jgi:PAS domain S-box-containing protein
MSAGDHYQKAALFDAMADGGLMGIVIYQGETVVYCNRRAEEILARPKERIVGAPIWDIVGEGMKEKMLSHLQDRMSGRDPGTKHYAFSSKTSEGNEIHVEFTVTSTTYEGKTAGIAALVDTTEILRRRAEAARSGGLFHAVFDASRDGMMILDKDGRLLDANVQMRRFFKVEGRGLAEIDELMHKDAKWQATWSELDASGWGQSRSIEAAVRGLEGKESWMEVWTDRFFIGTEPHLLVIVRDTTERRKAQEMLRNENEFFNAILDNARSVVIVADKDDRVMIFNQKAEELTGVSRADAKGRDWVDMLVAEEARSNARKELSGGRDSDEVMLPFDTPAGRRSLLWIVASHEREGAPVKIAIGVDITEMEKQRQRNEELNASLRLLNRILRHDITNDMMVAMGSLQLYDRRKEDRLLIQCMSALEKSVDLINDMADLEAVLANSELKVMDLGRLARKVAVKYQGGRMIVRVKGEASVMADDTLSSALDNLIRNASMHGGASEVAIDIWEDGEGAHLAVRDDGKGVPANIKSNIFEEGFKFGETGNTGLGLYIVRRSMERFGGSVKVEDNHPKGAIFILTFPAYAPV